MTTTIFLIVLWLLPVLLAWGRGVRARTCISITIICIFLGWTLVGWVLAAIWALEAPREV